MLSEWSVSWQSGILDKAGCQSHPGQTLFDSTVFAGAQVSHHFALQITQYSLQSSVIQLLVQAFWLHVFHTIIQCKEYRMSPN
jgi:hypothetical protein